MTIRHMKIFLTLCQNHCNTTKTAAELLMTQPAVSLAIKELEQYYGVVLFDRIGRRLKITEAGRKFREYAGHIITLFDDMEKGMRDWNSAGLIRIGASITIGSQLLPNYVKTFQSRCPETDVRVIIEPSDRLEEKIAESKLDFALIEGIPHNPFLVREEYMEDRLIVVCPANGKFRQGETITLEEFKKQKFLLRERGSGTRETFDLVIQKAGFSVTPLWEAMSTTALVNAVINGLGIAVLPYRMVLPTIQRGLIVSVNVEELDFRRRFNIIYHKEKFLTSSARAFIEMCRNYELDYPTPHYNGL